MTPDDVIMKALRGKFITEELAYNLLSDVMEKFTDFEELIEQLVMVMCPDCKKREEVVLSLLSDVMEKFTDFEEVIEQLVMAMCPDCTEQFTKIKYERRKA